MNEKIQNYRIDISKNKLLKKKNPNNQLHKPQASLFKEKNKT